MKITDAGRARALFLLALSMWATLSFLIPELEWLLLAMGMIFRSILRQAVNFGLRILHALGYLILSPQCLAPTLRLCAWIVN